MRTQTRSVRLLAGIILLCAGRAAWAQVANAEIKGVVTNQLTRQPLAGVTVVVSGPALQGDQTEFTDAAGRYLITQLPPGDGYTVTFYFDDVSVQRPGVRLTQGTTLTVSISMPTQKGTPRTIVIQERAPSVDTASAAVGQEINQEVLQNTAVRGRTFESVIALAPGAVDPQRGAGGEIGVSISGAASPENNFVIDGLNTTDPNVGLISTQLHQYFIKEVNVITGGYQAEYGRATGGVVSIVTKSGSNEFHGGAFGSWTPYEAGANQVARLGEALGTSTRNFATQYDYGFDVGGPIVKDRIWFYVGFAPTTTVQHTDRYVRTQTPDMNPAGLDFAGGRVPGKVDPGYQCPAYLAFDGYCNGPRTLALLTTAQPSPDGIDEYRRLYNWIVKLQFNLSPDHNITLSYIGSPQYNDLYSTYRDDLSATKFSETFQIHDVTAHYVGKLLNRRLQLDVLYGYHYQGQQFLPDSTGKQEIIYQAPSTNPLSLADLESVPACARQTFTVRNPATGVPATLGFNPCPVTSYQYQGFGQYTVDQTLQRHVITSSATYYLRLLGNHAFKIGFDFEDNLQDHTNAYTGTDFDRKDPFAGHYIFSTDPTGTGLRISRAYFLKSAMDAYGDAGVPCGPAGAGAYCYNTLRASTETRNYAAYLRDAWNVGFLPGLVLNLGVRWEGQEVYGQDRDSSLYQDFYGSDKAIAIYDNWAPRVGFAYDFTRRGRSKLYFNYGRFYESIPMDINDREFSPQGLLVDGTARTDCVTRSVQPGGHPLPYPAADSSHPCLIGQSALVNSGVYNPVQPGLRGQYINEIVTGFQYDVGLDIVLGVGYVFRDLGNIIEDLSVDGGSTFFVANPGSQPEAATIADLQGQVKIAGTQCAASDVGCQTRLHLLQQKLQVYQAVALFPQASRTYHAFQFTANKRLSSRFSILANYTYSRLLGNYPGTFSPVNGQLDPNISTQFDLLHLLANHTGPLPNDRPHNLKLTGFYVQPIGKKGSLTASLTFTLFSGRPINVLGYDPVYGPQESFILPAGSGGRTPLVTQLDMHLGYEHQLTKLLRLSLSADLINLLDQQAVTNTDDTYTNSPVLPILNGKPQDILRLKTADGSPLVVNSNFGNAVSYQEPFYLRVGARLSF